jgi:hypothetical protein
LPIGPEQKHEIPKDIHIFRDLKPIICNNNKLKKAKA